MTTATAETREPCQKMAEALRVLAMGKTIEGHKARAEFLESCGLRNPRLYGDAIVMIARAALTR